MYCVVSMCQTRLQSKFERGVYEAQIGVYLGSYLAIRQVSEISPDKDDGKEGPPRLEFTLINEWIGEETIVAAQWLLQQVCPPVDSR